MAKRVDPANRRSDSRPLLNVRGPQPIAGVESEASLLVPTKVFIVVLALSALFVSIYIQVAKNISETLNRASSLKRGCLDDTLIVADNMDAGYLDHVVGALLKFGHSLTFRDSMTPMRAADLRQFSVIWTHNYPFERIEKLDPNQRINHFPGSVFITHKLSLTTMPNLLAESNMLRAFRIPEERDNFLYYASQNTSKLWVQKVSDHRGISIVTRDSARLNQGDETFIQEYMDKPLLIDGKKFDIGVYAVLTSVDPLRVYIYEAEFLLRFCTNLYLDKETGAFNSSNIESYVVGDKYTPIWLMPSLVRYYLEANLSMKQTLNSYLLRLNKDGYLIWSQIEEIIKRVYRANEPFIAEMSRSFQEANNYNATSAEGSLNQFFELVRFDFIVNEDLNVFLMEANMSPNLSSRHFPPNRLLYEQVLSSFFSLVGLNQDARSQLTELPVHYLDGRISLPLSSVKLASDGRYGLDGIVGEKELAVFEDLCVSDECRMNCFLAHCKVCYFCLDDPSKLHLRRAIFEQNSRWNFKRLLPSTRDEDLDMQLLDPKNNQKLPSSDFNYIHVRWFRGKCLTDQKYCSYS